MTLFASSDVKPATRTGSNRAEEAFLVAKSLEQPRKAGSEDADGRVRTHDHRTEGPEDFGLQDLVGTERSGAGLPALLPALDDCQELVELVHDEQKGPPKGELLDRRREAFEGGIRIGLELLAREVHLDGLPSTHGGDEEIPEGFCDILKELREGRIGVRPRLERDILCYVARGDPRLPLDGMEQAGLAGLSGFRPPAARERHRREARVGERLSLPLPTNEALISLERDPRLVWALAVMHRDSVAHDDGQSRAGERLEARSAPRPGGPREKTSLAFRSMLQKNESSRRSPGATYATDCSRGSSSSVCASALGNKYDSQRAGLGPRLPAPGILHHNRQADLVVPIEQEDRF